MGMQVGTSIFVKDFLAEGLSIDVAIDWRKPEGVASAHFWQKRL